MSLSLMMITLKIKAVFSVFRVLLHLQKKTQMPKGTTNDQSIELPPRSLIITDSLQFATTVLLVHRSCQVPIAVKLHFADIQGNCLLLSI